MDDLSILHWTPRWHVWHGHNNQNVPCQCRCSSFFLFFPPPWISLNCIVRWIHVSEPGPTVTSCLLQSVCLKKKKKKKWRTKDRQCVDLEYKKRCILCKNCMHFIYCVWWGLSCPAARGTAGLLYCLLFHCRCQQCVRPGSAADWQTVPLQPAANQPVSNTCCY